jgi:hypothetical protein
LNAFGKKWTERGSKKRSRVFQQGWTKRMSFDSISTNVKCFDWIYSCLSTGLKWLTTDSYDRILSRINSLPDLHRTKARRILEWMTCATRPLKLHELQDALAIRPGDLTIDDEQRPITVRLRELCAPIVEVKHGEISFVHFSAQE